MKNYEIKRIKPLSLLKTFFYILLFPLIIYLLFGTVVLVTGLVTRDDFFIHDGLKFFPSAVLVVFACGAISIVTAAIYNVLAKHFGGLELMLEEKDKTEK